jgi:predicted PolB exonuclease-like 3'-5' exonuclease
MPDPSVIVFDLETVPDLAAAARMFGRAGAPEADVRQELGPDFPKLPLHGIACIGALVASRQGEGWRIDALGAPHIGERSEAELIAAFVERIAELKPQLVTFAGHGFDLPVLRYRAMLHRIAAPGLLARPYFNRYADDALDLCDALASFDARARVKLDEITRIIGLAGKPEGVDGSQVEAMVLAGKVDQVARYCESDVVNTYRLWLVYELFRGAITPAQLAWSEAQMREYVAGRKTANPYLAAALGIAALG